MKTHVKGLVPESALMEIERMKWAKSPLLMDFEDGIIIKHEGLGYSGAHKGRSAAWLWEKRLLRHGCPTLMADRTSGTWALVNARIASLCGTKAKFVTVGEPHAIVRAGVEGHGGEFVVVRSNAERRSALQDLIARRAWCPDQHNNDKVIAAFRETLGPETAQNLREADITPEQLRFVVAAVGTGGSAAGLAMGLRDSGYTHFELVGCDSTVSIVGGGVAATSALGLTIPGVGSQDELCRTFQMARTAFSRPLSRISPLVAGEIMAQFQKVCPEGCGMSSGVALAAARRLLPELRRGERVLVLFADNAARYDQQIEALRQ